MIIGVLKLFYLVKMERVAYAWKKQDFARG